MANEKYCVYKHTCPICVETNMAYESILEASNKTNIEYANMLKCLKHKKYCHTAGGYHWEYAGEVV